MASFRTLTAATLAAALAAAGGGFALADPSPWAHDHGHGRPEVVVPAAPVAAHGAISGTVIGVDYGAASIIVATAHGTVPVAVTPTTSIFRGSGFASFTDLTRGARVSVDFTEIGGRLVAQIIRIH